MHQVLSLASQAAPLLRSARKRRGLSQTDLAGRLGLAQSRVSEMERNPGRMSLDQLLAVCALLGLEVVLQPRGISPAGDGAVSEPLPQGW